MRERERKEEKGREKRESKGGGEGEEGREEGGGGKVKEKEVGGKDGVKGRRKEKRNRNWKREMDRWMETSNLEPTKKYWVFLKIFLCPNFH